MKRKPIAARFAIISALILITCILCFYAYTADKLPDALNAVISNWTGNSTEDREYPESFQAAKFVRVVDGDTLIVEVSGEQARVRLIGIDAPESVASSQYLDRTGKENTQEGQNASDFVKNLLADTETVYLQRDVSETDRYGRLLRYVWLELPEDEEDMEEISTKMLNGILVWKGIAEPAAYAPDTAHQEDFEYLAAYRDMFQSNPAE